MSGGAMLVPPCAVCKKWPNTGERWCSLAVWTAGDIPPKIDRDGVMIQEPKPGPSHRDVTGHVDCIRSSVAKLFEVAAST